MKCAVHPEVEATGYCRNCGKALCPQCTRDVRGVLYCEACLADLVAKPQPQPYAAVGVSPALAFLLGFVPGLGAVYNGEYTKALIHVIVFASFIGALNSDLGDPWEPVLGILLAAFFFYMAIDAARVAKARLRGQAPPAGIEDLAKDKPVGPIILIGLGLIFLLNRYIHVSHLLRQFWPLVLIGIGVLLLWKRIGQSS